MGKDIFVVQKHYAASIHYDLRLKIGEVLKSWAIPKEPSNKNKRSAIEKSDHLISYADFEGEIKDGYGKGKVEIWDKGYFENLKNISIEACLDRGHIEVRLKGKKLNGKFALIKANDSAKNKQDKNNNWMLSKIKG